MELSKPRLILGNWRGFKTQKNDPKFGIVFIFYALK